MTMHLFRSHNTAKQIHDTTIASGSKPAKPVFVVSSSNQKAVLRLQAQARRILDEVDESILVKKGKRSYPTFQRNEIELGKLLGVGGFCTVFEVNALHLEAAESPNRLPVSEEERSASASSVLGDDDDAHYQIEEARELMRQHYRRNNEARYAIKMLHKDLGAMERVRGKIDLAMEAKYLSALWHPNIVKMRAVASGDMLDSSFFIVMDRLYGTLADKLKSWAEMHKSYQGNIFGFGAKRSGLNHLLVDRMIVAYDLAAALRYMHENSLVYRDIKKENIGFDVRGDVKIFDFGLSKSLSAELKAKEHGKEVYGYRLTPRTGSLPFMAPEVATAKNYDEKCDVFSFAILLWEILTLKSAFRGMSRREYMERVVVNQERPMINRQWPPLTKLVLKEGWDDDPQKRPDMKRIASMLRGDLNAMSSDSEVQNRTRHMLERSAHSFRLENRQLTMTTNETNDSQVSA